MHVQSGRTTSGVGNIKKNASGQNINNQKNNYLKFKCQFCSHPGNNFFQVNERLDSLISNFLFEFRSKLFFYNLNLITYCLS